MSKRQKKAQTSMHRNPVKDTKSKAVANTDPLQSVESTKETEKAIETTTTEEKKKEQTAYSEEPRKFTNEPVVTLKIFSTVCGIKWDQLAGFKNYALREKLGPLSITDWKKELAAFRNRPTR